MNMNLIRISSIRIDSLDLSVVGGRSRWRRPPAPRQDE